MWDILWQHERTPVPSMSGSVIPVLDLPACPAKSKRENKKKKVFGDSLYLLSSLSGHEACTQTRLLTNAEIKQPLPWWDLAKPTLLHPVQSSNPTWHGGVRRRSLLWTCTSQRVASAKRGVVMALDSPGPAWGVEGAPRLDPGQVCWGQRPSSVHSVLPGLPENPHPALPSPITQWMEVAQ